MEFKIKMKTVEEMSMTIIRYIHTLHGRNTKIHRTLLD